MNFLKKLKEVVLSILPVVVICLFIHFFIHPFDNGVFGMFLISVCLVVFGETLFFLGVDNSIIPMGEIVGNTSNKLSKMFVLILFGFIFGFFATLAEPDVSVLAGQAAGGGVINASKQLFVFIVGAGVGVAVSIALFRIVTHLNFKIVLVGIIAIVAVVSVFVPESLLALAFDAGGATTGVITSPFLIAIASGISAGKEKSKNSDDAFGVIGIASLGPVLALLFYFLVSKTGGSTVAHTTEKTVEILGLAVSELEAACLSILPLVLFFFIFEILFVKLPKRKVLSLIIGAVVTFLGLAVFLFGLDYGFTSMGKELGAFIKTTPQSVIILFSAVLGFVICFTEPAVKILGRQIEDVTGGHIKSRVVIVSIGVSMCLALCLTAIRIIFDINFLIIIGICYAIALLAMIFSSSIFTGIGFDSGGVASGPISAAFVLPLMLGLADGASGFGVIALIGVMPIIVLQLLGIVYRIKLAAIARHDEKHALAIAYQIDMLSDISDLKEEVAALERKRKRGARKNDE